MSQLPAAHAWVEYADCGDLAPGRYVVQFLAVIEIPEVAEFNFGQWHQFDGAWFPTCDVPAYILSPNMGPIPDVEEDDE